MNNTNPLIAFIIELFNRLAIKSPTFFKVWKVIWGIPTLIIALPDMLQQFGLELPQLFNDQVNHVVGIASTVGLIMSFFPVKEPVNPEVKSMLPLSNKEVDTVTDTPMAFSGNKIVETFLLLIALSFIFCGSANAQFFSTKTPPKHRQLGQQHNQMIGRATVTELDSTFWDFRPIVVGAFSVQKDMSKSSIMVGTGLSLQHLKYTYPVVDQTGEVVKPGRFGYDVAVSLLSFVDVNSGATGATLISPGGMVSFLNGQYGIGWRYNTGLDKGQIVATFTVNFNN